MLFANILRTIFKILIFLNLWLTLAVFQRVRIT